VNNALEKPGKMAAGLVQDIFHNYINPDTNFASKVSKNIKSCLSQPFISIRNCFDVIIKQKLFSIMTSDFYCFANQ